MPLNCDEALFMQARQAMQSMCWYWPLAVIQGLEASVDENESNHNANLCEMAGRLKKYMPYIRQKV